MSFGDYLLPLVLLLVAASGALKINRTGHILSERQYLCHNMWLRVHVKGHRACPLAVSCRSGALYTPCDIVVPIKFAEPFDRTRKEKEKEKRVGRKPKTQEERFAQIREHRRFSTTRACVHRVRSRSKPQDRHSSAKSYLGRSEASNGSRSNPKKEAENRELQIK